LTLALGKWGLMHVPKV